MLTNNHVIDEATSVSATLVISGKTYTAKVLGYDSTDDVALLQLVGASGLKTVTPRRTRARSRSARRCSPSATPAAAAASRRPRRAPSRRLNQTIQASDSGAGTHRERCTA